MPPRPKVRKVAKASRDVAALGMRDDVAFLLRLYDSAFARAVAFTWTAVDGATSYILQVGSISGTYGIYNADVGNVITAEVRLTPSTYYARVVPVGAGSPTAEQTWVVA